MVYDPSKEVGFSFLFFFVGDSLRDLSSPTGDGSCALCSGSTES